jgi:hypothetical protein
MGICRPEKGRIYRLRPEKFNIAVPCAWRFRIEPAILTHYLPKLFAADFWIIIDFYIMIYVIKTQK